MLPWEKKIPTDHFLRDGMPATLPNPHGSVKSLFMQESRNCLPWIWLLLRTEEPSIHFLHPLSLHGGGGRAGANPSWLSVRGRVQPGQIRGLTTTHPHMPVYEKFTRQHMPIPIWCLWAERGSRSSWREPTQMWKLLAERLRVWIQNYNLPTVRWWYKPWAPQQQNRLDKNRLQGQTTGSKSKNLSVVPVHFNRAVKMRGLACWGESTEMRVSLTSFNHINQ